MPIVASPLDDLHALQEKVLREWTRRAVDIDLTTAMTPSPPKDPQKKIDVLDLITSPAAGARPHEATAITNQASASTQRTKAASTYRSDSVLGGGAIHLALGVISQPNFGMQDSGGTSNMCVSVPVDYSLSFAQLPFSNQ
jgi:hypothetical protein